MTSRRVLVGPILAALVACHGERRAADDAAPPAPVIAPADAAPAGDAGDDSDETAELDVGDSEAAALRQAGAIPAWRGVVDRARYLARRGQRGALYGRLVTVDGVRWLVDEAEGAGALGARVDLGGATDLTDGDRLVAWGAWTVVPAPGGSARHWVWAADEIARLPARAAPVADGYAATRPGHDLESVEHLAQPAVVVESVPRRGGGIVFEVVSGPHHRGDGWTIAGRSHWPAAAILDLPGDEESYGGQDLRADDERWHLQRKVRYVLRVARWRPPRHPGDLPILRAISPPKKLVEPDGSAAD